MTEPNPVPDALRARVEALRTGAVPSAPPGPGAVTPVTWTVLVFSLLPAVAGAAVEMAATSPKDEGCLGVGLGVGGFFFVIFLIALISDLCTPSPRTRTTPERAVKAFYGALRRKSYGRAYACLSPLDRISDLRPTLAIGRLDVPERTFSFKDKAGFQQYWREQAGVSTAFLGGYHKTIQATIVRVTPLSADLAAADLKLEVSGYPSLAILGIFCGLVPALLLILLMTRREYFEVRKLLVKKDGLWWIVNGEFTPEGDEAIERMLAGPGK
jgi:hypothetical protein